MSTPDPSTPTATGSESDVHARRRLRALRRALGILLLGVFATFTALAVRGVWRDAASARVLASPGAIAITALATSAWLATLHGAFHRLVLRARGGGVRPSFVRTASIFYRAHLARYVPGKVAQVGVLTAGLVSEGHRTGAAVGIAGAHVFNFGVSAGVAALALAPLYCLAGARAPAGLLLALGAVSLVAAALWIARPRRMAGVVPSGLVRLLRGEAGEGAGGTPGGRARDFATYVGVSALQGATVLPLVLHLEPSERDWWAIAASCGAYPVARLIGQAALLTPGGLGVREGAYAMLAAPLLGVTGATGVAVWMRAAASIGEIAMFMGFSLLDRARAGGRRAGDEAAR